MIHDAFDLIGLPDRPSKPRETGLTHILDKGLSPQETENVLEVAADVVDLAKLGWGTAVITPELERKLDIYREADVPFVFGGTLFEAYFLRDQIDEYRPLIDELGVRHVKI